METQKNNIYFRKVNFLLFKVCLWVVFCFIFLNFSFLRPSGPNHIGREFIVFLFLALVINIHTSYLYPKISKKHWLHIPILILLIILCSLFEVLVFPEIFDATYYTFLDKHRLYTATICNILVRNFALFIFFLWVEYWYRLILLLYQKEAIHQKEISLLMEKQEFEKNYSRKKLLPHYFFNILELVRVNKSFDDNNNELLDKVSFILYYFLVDVEHEKVELDKELAFYRYYIDLENIRHKEKTKVHFNVCGETKDIFVIPLIFEPLIGNALKYSKKNGEGIVYITFDATQFPELKFHCKNNFSVCAKNVMSSESGLKILEQRLNLCYKDNYTLNTSQDDDYYEVTLLLKMI